MRKSAFLLPCLALGMMFLAGCVTVGNRFPGDAASKIAIGKTTRQDIENQLGAPFRTGLDSGDPTATYLYYKFGLFNRPITEDLTIRYGTDGRVKSYTYNSNQN